MLINVFIIIRKSQVDEFDQGWSQTLQESGSREPDLSIPAFDPPWVSYHQSDIVSPPEQM